MTAWIITKDHIADPEDRKAHPEGGRNSYAKNLTGPREASEKDIARLEAGEGIEFRLLDDDGEVYYEGRRLEESDADKYYNGEETEFAPLNNFGMPNAGCTIQQEKNKEGKWEPIN